MPSPRRSALLRFLLVPVVAALSLSACAEPDGPRALSPLAPTLDEGGLGRPVVLVNPRVRGNGAASTIQEGIDMVAPGGRVMVLPGTYAEALTIDKALTLEGIADGSGPVKIEPPGQPSAAIEITAGPVTILDVSIRFTSLRGIHGNGAFDVTVERVALSAHDQVTGLGATIYLENDARVGGGRAHLMAREDSIDGGVASTLNPHAQTFGILAAGDVDAVVTENVVHRTGGACIWISPRPDYGGETNAEVRNNDVDECYPLGKAGAILVGPPAPILSSASATGVVDVIGNTIQNSQKSCLTGTGVSYEEFTGRIERNRILDAVQPCATPSGRNLNGAIWVGSTKPLAAVHPTVRYNDIVGNAHAGLRIGPNESSAIDARCNWWGAADGPSGIGPGSGDAVVVQPGAATPMVTPFATAPIAQTAQTTCSGGST